MTTKTWRKSSHSNAQSACVELAVEPDATAVRDSKAPHTGALSFGTGQFGAFLDVVKRGQA